MVGKKKSSYGSMYYWMDTKIYIFIDFFSTSRDRDRKRVNDILNNKCNAPIKLLKIYRHISGGHNFGSQILSISPIKPTFVFTLR